MSTSSRARSVLCLLSGLSAAGCSDYVVAGLGEPEEEISQEDSGAGGEVELQGPDLQVSPEEVDLGTTCGAGEAAVTLTNVGDEALRVHGLVMSSGFSMAGPELPLHLGPGEGAAYVLTGLDAEGKLEVLSDVPHEPIITIPLRHALDAPPAVAFRTPSADDLLVSDEASGFLVEVSDDADAPEELVVSWRSDPDGALGTSAVDTEGLSSLAWDPEGRTLGEHTITASVTDSCGSTTEASLPVCQDGFADLELLDLGLLTLSGEASLQSAAQVLELTPPQSHLRGTGFEEGRRVLSDNVYVSFEFNVSGGTGADGLTFTALDGDRYSSLVGQEGGYLGYDELPGWTVEIDTYPNPGFGDHTDDDHVSLHVDGDLTQAWAYASLPDMEDGQWHDLEITVRGQHITVEVDGTTYIDSTVSAISEFPAHVGFTGATGSDHNNNRVRRVFVERRVCEP